MPTIQILLAGVDVTDKVVFAQTSFQSKVNGQSGQGKMRVRDDDSTFTFTVGADWLLLIDGDAAWRGFAMQRKLAYIAPAMDVAESGLQRFVDVWGPDGNILFSRRIVAKSSSPATVEGTQFPAATADTTAITELVSNWLDLSADSIDTSSSVAHVGNLDPAQKTRAWSGGWAWGDAMNTIAMLPAAIYYLRPESGTPNYTLVYCDADAPTAPFGLSDQPDGTTTKGYRESEIILDATGMVNDELAWGIGYGSQRPVFKRLTSTSSVTSHGLWQGGTQAVGVYKQSTIDRIADSIVNGSPSNHRGAKNDRPAVELVTYEPGLLAGHVVDFDSQVWGWSDAIPVRQSDITFEAPDLPRWKLLLSHEIDTPWGFYDQFWPKIPSWPLPCLTPPCTPTPPPPPPTACQCVDPSTVGVVDSFSRTEASGWGDNDLGATYAVDSGTLFPGGTYASSVAPGGGAIACSGNAYLTEYVSTAFPDGDWDLLWSFEVSTVADGSTWGNLVYLQLFDNAMSYITEVDVWVTGGSGGDPYIGEVAFWGGDTSTPASSWAGATLYDCRVRYDATGMILLVRVWEHGTTEPEGWQATKQLYVATVFGGYGAGEHSYAAPSSVTATFRGIGFPGFDRCAAPQFDDFDRTVADGWGIAAPSGFTWIYDPDFNGTPPSSATVSVDGAHGVAVIGTDGTSPVTPAMKTTGWAALDAVTITVLLSVSATDPDNSDTAFEVDLWSGSAWTGSLAIARIDWTSGSIGVYDGSSWTYGAFTPFAYGDAAILKMDVGPSGVSASAWLQSSAEPGVWQVQSGSATGASYASMSIDLYLNNTLSSPSSDTFTVDSIDFSYAGRPCFYNCPPEAVIDDFERTDGTDLGTATPSGVAWTYFGSGSVAYSVDGHSGIRSYGSDTTGVISTGARLTLPSAYPEGVEFYAEFQASGEPTSGPFAWGENIAFGSGTAWDIIEVSAIPVGFDTVWSVTAQNGPGTSSFRTASPGDASSWWAVRVQRLADHLLAKAWLRDSESEPDWQISVSRSSPVDPSTAVIDWGGHGSYAPADLGSASLAVLSAGVAGCVPVDSQPQGLPSGPGGWGCEVPTRVSSTVFSTSSTFAAGSVLAWRDGLLQTPGSGYTEDSGLQSITFSTTVGSGEEVRVCYLAQVVP